MFKKIIFIIFIGVLESFVFPSNLIHYTILPKSQFYLEGSTNINRFSCLYKKKFGEGSLRFDISADGSWIKLQNAVMYLETESLDCNNKLMNKDLHKALKSTDYPQIKIQILQINQQNEKLENNHDWILLQTHVALSIAGVTKNMILPVKAKKLNNQYHFLVCQDILMSDFNITPPSPLFGAVKVRNKITVHLDLLVDIW